ncbi:MAG: hypothetical protein FJ098_07565, partial [Deltaproteobacteria bacterium]|nr:hypothetical protein [Deltaproteobacteria bacterium]
FRCTAEHLCEQILYCDSDKDCKDYGKVCDKVLGECVDCLTDADCPVDGFCQAAECFPDVCDQAVEGPVCLDGDVVDCSENGSVALLLQDCPEGTFCSDAACNPWICLPGVPGCDGDLAFVCNAEGSGYAFTEDCGGGDIACVAGECLEVACQPGETVCLNEKATVTCHEDGQTFEVVECGTGFYCDAGVGACLEWVCVPYDAWCEGSVAMLCDPIGASATETQDCADDELWCVSGECVACEPDCAGLQCGDDGCGGSCGACPAGSACAWDGQCHGQVCTGACTGTSDSALFCGLDVCTPGEALGVQVTSPSSATITGAWSVMEHWGAAQNDLLVQGPPSYLALLSGLVASAEHSDDLPGNGQWDDPWSTSNGFDAVRIAYSLQAPPGASGFCVDSWFLSREFGQTQQFNDKFYILLTAAVTTGGQATPINYMPCPAPGTYTSFTGADGIAYCYVTVESGFDACQAGSAPDLSATGFTCGYGWMRTCWPLEEGEAFELAFHVHDAQDSLYDSAAVADHFTWQYGKPQQGTWFLE